MEPMNITLKQNLPRTSFINLKDDRRIMQNETRMFGGDVSVQK
jgi:hypothetical protein